MKYMYIFEFDYYQCFLNLDFSNSVSIILEKCIWYTFKTYCLIDFCAFWNNVNYFFMCPHSAKHFM